MIRMLGSSVTLPVTLSHPAKVFWPDEGYTKRDLAEFYASIFPKLQPYVRARMMTLERCPDGMGGECFYQKQIPRGMPPGTPTQRIENVEGKRRFTDYVVGGSLTTQIALVNLGCIAVHVMATRARAPRQPDWVCIDIDPGSGRFGDAAEAGLRVREALRILDLPSFAKTSGGRGLHVFVPIRTGPDANEVLAFAESFAARVAAAHPGLLTVEHTLAARRGRVYLDPFRNAFGQTVVAPYSVRRRPIAPVSTPLHWSEVDARLVPSEFNIASLARRVRGSDPWNAFFESRQSLKDASRRLSRL